MFKPLRFNQLLKAIPGLNHLQLTPQANYHPAHSTHTQAPTHTHITAEVEVDEAQITKHAIKATHIQAEIEKDITISRKPGSSQVHRQVSEEIKVSKTTTTHPINPSETLTRVHSTMESVTVIEMTPPHPPREETPIYMRSHHHLVHTLDTPCAICGVSNSTLHNPKENLFGATAIETHHYPIERSLMNACDPQRIHVIFPQVKDRRTLEEFIDSEENLMVLCDIHHRHPHYGIHHILAQDFFIQPFLYGGYQIVADKGEEAKVLAADEKIIKRHLKSGV